MAPEEEAVTGLNALAAMHDADRARGVDPFARPVAISAGPTPAPPPTFIVPPFDTSSFVEVVRVREPDPALHREDEEATPAKRTPRPARTPNIDIVRGWKASQMKAADA